MAQAAVDASSLIHLEKIRELGLLEGSLERSSPASLGALLFQGTVNEPATVTVEGKPAQVAAANAFAAQAQAPSGTNQVVVTATDPSSNTRINSYHVAQSDPRRPTRTTSTRTSPATGRRRTNGMPKIG